MGIFDVHARSYKAPSSEERRLKQELNRLEEAEHDKNRQLRHELEALEKVEHIKRDNAYASQALAVAHERRRAVSGLENRNALAQLERERLVNAQLAASRAPGPGALLSPNIGMNSLSPQIHSYGSHTTLLPSTSPVVGVVGTPRIRTLSHVGGAGLSTAAAADALARQRLAAAHPVASPALAGLSADRMRLEARKAELAQREAALLQAKGARISNQRSALDLRQRERDLSDRIAMEGANRALDAEEDALRARMAEEDLEARLNRLSVNTPSLNPLLASPGRGHARHLSTPGNMAIDPILASPLMGGGLNDVDLLGPSTLSSTYGSGLGHTRSRSHSHVGLAVSSPYDLGLSLGGMTDPALGGGLGLASPRLPTVFPSTDPVLGGGGGGLSLEDELLAQDLAAAAATGGSRSRRGSLSSYGDLGGLGSDPLLGSPAFDAYGGSAGAGYGGRLRRESLPFEETALFDTRGY